MIKYQSGRKKSNTWGIPSTREAAVPLSLVLQRVYSPAIETGVMLLPNNCCPLQQEASLTKVESSHCRGPDPVCFLGLQLLLSPYAPRQIFLMQKQNHERCMGVLPACMSVYPHVCSIHRGQKRVFDLLQLELTNDCVSPSLVLIDSQKRLLSQQRVSH
ncbi:hypothetical protein STEG23_031893 [Scotinomys teguina]